MIAPKFQQGTLTSAAITRISLTQGQAYYLAIGDEAANFNSQSVTPKLSTGVNDGDASEGTLTVDTQVTAGDTMTIGTRVYTFVANDQDPKGHLDEIQIGSDLATTQANIVAAINGTDTDAYAIEAHEDVSAAAFSLDDSVITARKGGIAGDLIATTETFTAGTNVFDAATLGTTTAGTDDYTEVIALPQIASEDSAGSPLAFSDEGMVGFDAILPELLLVPSGAVTSVPWKLAEDGAAKGNRNSH